jgi:hypothetical protein
MATLLLASLRAQWALLTDVDQPPAPLGLAAVTMALHTPLDVHERLQLDGSRSATTTATAAATGVGREVEVLVRAWRTGATAGSARVLVWEATCTYRDGPAEDAWTFEGGMLEPVQSPPAAIAALQHACGLTPRSIWVRHVAPRGPL